MKGTSKNYHQPLKEVSIFYSESRGGQCNGFPAQGKIPDLVRLSEVRVGASEVNMASQSQEIWELLP